jgi:hypothetical protein
MGAAGAEDCELELHLSLDDEWKQISKVIRWLYIKRSLVQTRVPLSVKGKKNPTKYLDEWTDG